MNADEYLREAQRMLSERGRDMTAGEYAVACASVAQAMQAAELRSVLSGLSSQMEVLGIAIRSARHGDT